mmetsp:Transcript_99877/g.250385  ORF Transcript_99877/g.250385 Transcript_99877/m.250385 type:complete len:203 (-) Transcript_99877:465-1073(-)
MGRLARHFQVPHARVRGRSQGPLRRKHRVLLHVVLPLRPHVVSPGLRWIIVHLEEAARAQSRPRVPAPGPARLRLRDDLLGLPVQRDVLPEGQKQGAPLGDERLDEVLCGACRVPVRARGHVEVVGAALVGGCVRLLFLRRLRREPLRRGVVDRSPTRAGRPFFRAVGDIHRRRHDQGRVLCLEQIGADHRGVAEPPDGRRV